MDLLALGLIMTKKFYLFKHSSPKHWILLFAFIPVGYGFAQDTTAITFSQEPDTLVRQRFIDRYENVFMTKVPTRNILKVGYLTSFDNGIGLKFAYEYKILPSLSMEASFYTQTNYQKAAIYLESFNKQLRKETMFLSLKGRWYFDMEKRIRNALNANNFSGKYLSLSYEQSLASFYRLPKRKNIIGLSYGFQSRFLESGFVDFSIGLFHLSPITALYWRADIGSNGFSTKNMVIASQTSIGLAFGDWKKSGRAPLCELLLCDQLVSHQFKVKFPEISIGIARQAVRAEIGYERKIGKSPFSVNLRIGNTTYRIGSKGYTPAQDILAFGEAQVRFYFLQKHQIRTGKASNSLSGMYLGPVASYRYTYAEFGLSTLPIGGLIGYQQRLFKNIYFDSAISWGKDYSLNKRIRSANYSELKAEVGLGFAF